MTETSRFVLCFGCVAIAIILANVAEKRPRPEKFMIDVVASIIGVVGSIPFLVGYDYSLS